MRLLRGVFCYYTVFSGGVQGKLFPPEKEMVVYVLKVRESQGKLGCGSQKTPRMEIRGVWSVFS